MELSECSFAAGIIRPPVFPNGEKSSHIYTGIKEVYKGATIPYCENELFHIFHGRMSNIPGFGGEP